MIAYASRTGTRRNLAALKANNWRLLVSAVGPLRSEGFDYALDNGAWSAYTQGRPFDEDAFLKALRRMARGVDWTVIPDIVAGGAASLEFSIKWMRRVLDECQRGLLAVQDGMSADDVRPFIGSRVGLFVGGSTEWKLRTLPEWADLARQAGCWCHVGRVNTVRRIGACTSVGVTSFDGSSASRYAVTVPKLSAAVRQLGLFGGGTNESDDI